MFYNPFYAKKRRVHYRTCKVVDSPDFSNLIEKIDLVERDREKMQKRLMRGSGLPEEESKDNLLKEKED